MKRLLTLLTLCGLAISSLAQTQQGYVKTLGRPNQKGVALSDVTIRVKGVHNTVLSKNDGRFSMQIDGDSYTLQQVQKSGYELNEPGVIGRSYAYSANVPLTLVMVSTSQLQADKQRIENKAYQVAEKNYKAKLALLEKQKEENSITIEQYRQQIQDLQDKFEKYQSLIDGLADHYAHVDYDDLDEKEREINLCIENGELEKAESLLNQLGIQQRIADIEKRLATGQGLMDEANSDMAAVLKQQEKDAEYLYQLYTIALSSYDNEKAQFLIETRAALDTTNVEWQNQAGSFIRNYIADYDKALYYYQLALRQSIEKYGEENGRTTSTYNNIGLVYSDQGDYSKAQDLFFKALAIDKKVFGLEHPELAVSYNNIGLAYYYQGDYSNALEYYYLSLSIEEKLLDIDNPSIATSYSNIGVAYKEQGNYPKALEYHFKALAIREKMLGLEHLTTAYSYHNIGIIYEDQGDKPKALEYYFKALAIFEKSLGVEHPSTATSYNSIGFVYDDQGVDRVAASEAREHDADILPHELVHVEGLLHVVVQDALREAVDQLDVAALVALGQHQVALDVADAATIAVVAHRKA